MHELMSVEGLLNDEGVGSLLSYEGYRKAALLAEQVAQTIESPINRVLFIAESCNFLISVHGWAFETLLDQLDAYIVCVDREDSSHPGSTHIWASLVQDVERIYVPHFYSEYSGKSRVKQ